jgi:hypothetical protein
MFKQKKYTNWYYKIVSNAKTRNDGDECHHIIPRCLGGTDEPDNLVFVTYREHFILHLLLTKMHDSVKLKNSLWQMSFKNKNKYFNSNLYQISRNEYVNRISGEKHWSKSPEFRKKVSDSWTEDRKENFKSKVSGNNHWTTKTDMNTHSELMRQKIDRVALSERSKKFFTENNPMKRIEISSKFKKPKEIVTCPHCKKTGGKPVMYRYHFDKCKENE